MAAAKPKAPSGPRVRADSDIYTVMVAVACFATLGAIVFGAYRCYELLGTAFPGF